MGREQAPDPNCAPGPDVAVGVVHVLDWKCPRCREVFRLPAQKHELTFHVTGHKLTPTEFLAGFRGSSCCFNHFLLT
jgi:hypothetical protein